MNEYQTDQDSLKKALQLHDDEVLEQVINTLSHKYEDSIMDNMINSLFKD